jgi:hypothetical protein
MSNPSRKAFNFYSSHWEQIKLLNKKQQLELFNAICQVQFLEVNIDDINFKDNVLNIVWTGIKHSIQTSLNGYITKQKSLKNEIVPPLAKGLAKGGIPIDKTPSQQEKEEGKEKEEEKEQLEGLKFSELKKETWDRWCRYKESQFKFKYMTIETEQVALSKLIKISRNSDKIANSIIDQTIENGWKGLFELKTNGEHKHKITPGIENDPNKMKW